MPIRDSASPHRPIDPAFRRTLRSGVLCALLLGGSIWMLAGSVDASRASHPRVQAAATTHALGPVMDASIRVEPLSPVAHLPVPPDSRIVSRARSDPHNRARSLVVVNDRGIGFNRRFYQEWFVSHGWTKHLERHDGAAVRIVFVREAATAVVAITRSDRGRTVVVASF